MSITWDNGGWNDSGWDTGMRASPADRRTMTANGRGRRREETSGFGRLAALVLLLATGLAAAAALWVSMQPGASRSIEAAVADLLREPPAMQVTRYITPAEIGYAEPGGDTASAAPARNVTPEPAGTTLAAPSRASAAQIVPPNPVTTTVIRPAAVQAEQPLPVNSSRFASVDPAAYAAAKAEIAEKLAASALPSGDASAPVDPAGTASIAVAETEDAVVAMESELAASGSDGFAEAAATEAAAAGEPAHLAPDGSVLAAARAGAWVNMRAGPNNDAEVMAIVPLDAPIYAEEGCRHWCAVEFEGKPGYIYRSYIRYPDAG